MVAAVAGAVVLLVAGRVRPRALLLGLALVAGALSGGLAAHRTAASMTARLPVGIVDLRATVLTDVEQQFGEGRFLVRPSQLVTSQGPLAWAGPPLQVVLPEDHVGTEPRPGESVRVAGSLRTSPRVIKAIPVAGALRATSVDVVGAGNPMYTAGNALRSRVQRVMGRSSGAEAALLRGFLVGDVTDLAAIDQEAMRRAGLSHFVAVSGSNVALFLVVWWLVLLPVGLGPRRRAVLGIVGVAVFMVTTRWEPSVVRAGTMAVLALGARLVGYPLDAWTALGAGVVGLIAVSGDLAQSLGFQLSAAATAGLLVGSGLFRGRRPQWLWATLGATVAAQVAVAPLLLFRFGEIPVAAPLANVVAAPLVGVATAIGAAAVVVGHPVVVTVAEWPAGAVLWVAHTIADWPQLGVVQSLIGGVALMGLTRPRLRLPVVAAAVATAFLMVVVSAFATHVPGQPMVTFLDVGQGDATLLRGSDGSVVLVDGGRDPGVLAAALRRYGVDTIDLLVATHGDDDHIGGLMELPGRVPVGVFWHPDHPDNSEGLRSLAAAFDTAAVPKPGVAYRVGQFTIDVLGPKRRFDAVNDGSLVLWVDVSKGSSLVLTGDIEAVGQADVGPLAADILKVPHHGSITSDLDWLRQSRASIAVISVGPNSFGHPRREVIEALVSAGAEVRRTDELGDISISLAP